MPWTTVLKTFWGVIEENPFLGLQRTGKATHECTKCADYCARLGGSVQPLSNVWLIGYSDSGVHNEFGVAQVPKVCTPVCANVSNIKCLQQDIGLQRIWNCLSQCQALTAAVILTRSEGRVLWRGLQAGL